MPASSTRAVDNAEIVITGATNGIGKEIARDLAGRHARLTLVARNPHKAQDTADELLGLGAAHVDIVEADLADLNSVRAASVRLQRRLEHIDVLINNAGITLFRSEAPTVDGYDRMIATNHLAPFLLTNEILELLTAAPSARIVHTASEAHRHAHRPDPATLGQPREYGLAGGQLVYGESKLLNILFTKELARRLHGTRVTANCFCPGAVSTGLVRDSSRISRVWSTGARARILRRPAAGAAAGLRLVLDPDLDGVTGQFFTSTPGLRLLPPVAALADHRLHQQIWQRSAELVGL
ncbi:MULTISPECIES: SDR family NAD(P)-dependent oxidoreductase [unclassified Nocardia]|uniref:SDR family NAD(P)-dependent oxidoreductase n=1 Tax=unclassified Nocardia TaxID=2637762 RepID=UPI0033BB1611